jgi:hypothetical protein
MHTLGTTKKKSDPFERFKHSCETNGSLREGYIDVERGDREDLSRSLVKATGRKLFRRSFIGQIPSSGGVANKTCVYLL